MWSESDGSDKEEGGEAAFGAAQPTEDDLTFGLNKSYADRFEKRKKAQELAQLKAKLRDEDDDSDASSEDEQGEMLTKEMDLQIFKTIDKIRNKAPEIYQPDAKFFDNAADDSGDEEEEDSDDDDDGSDDKDAAEVKTKQTKSKKDKPYTLTQQLLDRGATALVSDDEDEDEDESKGKMSRRGKSLAYDAEQRELREAFLKQTGGNEEDDENDDEGDGGVLTKKEISQEQRATEREDYAAWLRHQLEQEEHKHGGEVDESLTLRRYMHGEQLNEEERFLRDYVLNAMWKGPGAGVAEDKRGQGRGDEYEEDGGAKEGEGRDAVDEEDEEDDRADAFERRHNFRFEEEGATQVMTHPRHDPNSVRRQAALGRKAAAEEQRKARKAEAKAQKEAELRRLKNLKKQEILDRLRKIEEISGGATALSEVDLSGDFDPETWDKRMGEIFNDDYYNAEDEGFRAAEDELDERAAYMKNYEDAGAGEEWGGGDGDWDGGGGAGGGGAGGDRAGGLGFDAVTARLKKSGDAAQKKTVQQYMDEYYALDYEDLIGGEIPTRFKYMSVPASGFGMTDEELLNADESTLRKRVPLKYVKRPYAQLDEAAIKGKAKRVAWEEKREKKVKERMAQTAQKAKEAAMAAKAEAKKKRKQQQREAAATAGGELESRDSGATASNGGESGSDGARKKRKRSKSPGGAGDAGGEADNAESKRKMHAKHGDTSDALSDAKAAAKAAKLLKKGVSEQRLQTFAKLGKVLGKKKKKADAEDAPPAEA